MSTEYLCKGCGKPFVRYNSLQSKCPRCVSNNLKKRAKRLNPIGRIGQKWIETRKEWIKNNPGPWVCYLCGLKLDISSLTLDHVMSRSRFPALRFVMSNLKPCCLECNKRKGSRVIL